jgi:hypothetical protein
MVSGAVSKPMRASGCFITGGKEKCNGKERVEML